MRPKIYTLCQNKNHLNKHGHVHLLVTIFRSKQKFLYSKEIQDRSLFGTIIGKHNGLSSASGINWPSFVQHCVGWAARKIQ